MSEETLLSLHDKLRGDNHREALGFSEEMEIWAQLLHLPFAYDHEVAEALRQWCMKNQPCQFGRVAATREQLFFCILRWRDLAEGDSFVREKIHQAKLLWKQRALTVTDSPPHGLLILCATPELTAARPDQNLKRFSERLLALAGWSLPRRAKLYENPIASDFLYLRNPEDHALYGFQFNIDFFAAAGDRRWWHDHRLPGGIGFTANSTGHMKAFLE